MNSDVLQFEGQYYACDNTVLVESKLVCAAKIGAERSFLPQKHGSKKKENLSLSQRMGVGVLFYDCETCVCLICGATVATAKRHNVERHFTTNHKNYNANYPPGSALRAEKALELKTALGKRQDFFTRRKSHKKQPKPLLELRIS